MLAQKLLPDLHVVDAEQQPAVVTPTQGHVGAVSPLPAAAPDHKAPGSLGSRAIPAFLPMATAQVVHW